VHVPGEVPLHVWQVPHDAGVQQTLSTHVPVAQSPVTLQGWPIFFLQAPLALQVVVPVHVSASSALPMVVHVPAVAPSQRWQVPHAATSQHTPSTQ
jgi:hypothetical protein